MERSRKDRSSPIGYLLVLLGCTAWIVGCFLRLYRIPNVEGAYASLYEQITFGSGAITIGGILYLFGAVAVIAVISVMRLAGRWPRAGTVLVGAVLAWLIVSVGVLISLGGARNLNPGWSLAIGYWCLWASVVCLAAGIVIIVTTGRSSDGPRARRVELGVR